MTGGDALSLTALPRSVAGPPGRGQRRKTSWPHVYADKRVSRLSSGRFSQIHRPARFHLSNYNTCITRVFISDRFRSARGRCVGDQIRGTIAVARSKNRQ